MPNMPILPNIQKKIINAEIQKKIKNAESVKSAKYSQKN